MSNGKYERELEGILSGEKHIIDYVTQTCSSEEKERYQKIRDIPFIAIRSAGSFKFDLLALRGSVSFVIEVKSSKNKRLYFGSSPQLIKQLNRIEERCTAVKTLPFIAYRLKGERGEKWKLFTMEIEGLSKKYRILNKKVPKLEKTKSETFKMEWEKGMPLNEFIGYLSKLLG